MTSKCAVYILSGNPDQTRLLQTRFQDPFFDLKVYQIEVPEDFSLGDVSRKKANEWYRFSWVLRDFDSSTFTHVLIIKDNIVGNSDSSTYAEIIEATMNGTDFDICYCARWWDNCEVHTDKKSIANRTTLIAKTHGVSGTGALLVSRHGARILLGKETMKNGKTFDLTMPLGEQLKTEIMNENINATVIVPSLFSFDITKAKTVDDYKKLAECQIPSINNKSSTVIEPGTADASVKIMTTTNSNMSWVLWFLVAIFILLVCYISISALRQYIKSSSYKREVDSSLKDEE
jgi:hypothetical protein